MLQRIAQSIGLSRSWTGCCGIRCWPTQNRLLADGFPGQSELRQVFLQPIDIIGPSLFFARYREQLAAGVRHRFRLTAHVDYCLQLHCVEQVDLLNSFQIAISRAI
jgi:hypothetical protein